MNYSRGGRGRGRGLSFSSQRSYQNDGYGSYGSSRDGYGPTGPSDRRGGYRGGRGRGGYGRRGNVGADEDGDILMAEVGSDQGRRNVIHPPNGGAPTFNGAVDEVLVENVTNEIMAHGLIMWLNKRARHSPAAVLVDSQHRGNSIVLKTENAMQAQALARLSGINFNDRILRITQGGVPSPSSSRDRPGQSRSGAGGAIVAIQNLIQSRYRADIKFLDLTNMVSDPILVNAGVTGLDGSQSKVGPVICKVIGQFCPDVQTISFASNGLKSLHLVSSLPTYVPKVTALSFQDNALRSLRDIEPLKGVDLPHLRELLLTGNPVREKEMSKPGGSIVFRSDVKKLFPTISVLDMEPVTGDITFAINPTAVELPLPARPGFMDSPATAATVYDFLQKFFTSFDTNRNSLSDLYHDHACFSLILDGRPAASQRRDSRPSQYHQFEKWRVFDRNHEKIKEPEKRVRTIRRGGAQIMNIFSQLPKTLHPVDQLSNGKLFLVEAYQTGSAADATIFVMVRGEFTEVDTRTSRSFDRTFIIVPPAPGSRSALSGLPYSVANDQLTIRAYAGDKAWAHLQAAPQQTNTPTVAPTTQANGLAPAPQLPDMAILRQLQMQHGLDDAKHNAVIEFAKASGLNYQFSLQCLSETAWSLPHAMQAFQNVKHTIPPEAYRI